MTSLVSSQESHQDQQASVVLDDYIQASPVPIKRAVVPLALSGPVAIGKGRFAMTRRLQFPWAWVAARPPTW